MKARYWAGWNAYMRRYRKAHPAKLRTYEQRRCKPVAHKAVIAAWHSKRKAKRFGRKQHYTGEQFLMLCKATGNICLRCRRHSQLTPDHVKPLSKGGSNRVSNI